ncbi:hypothetical protein FN846DRAFT_925305 [Sphaerosporella brunnea]|uniref:J domain-containing protein n=1 Tax=Sphaerosporella brunnea TaxID=1250544 RepID=A0A5J5FBT2_9PEZI|nr:hypothetical protein FN846DRAFT_925305 [Sphaerosporella brunnea]
MMPSSSTSTDCPYCVMGLAGPMVTEKELKDAYKALALQHHPDKHRPEDMQKQTAIFQKIRAAHEVLHDPIKRSKVSTCMKHALPRSSGRAHAAPVAASTTTSSGSSSYPYPPSSGSSSYPYPPSSGSSSYPYPPSSFMPFFGRRAASYAATQPGSSFSFTFTTNTPPIASNLVINSVLRRASALEEQASMKEQAAEQLARLISKRVKPGSHSWHDRMRPVEYRLAEARSMRAEAKRLRRASQRFRDAEEGKAEEEDDKEE